MPLLPVRKLVTLGEGGTPLLRLERLEKAFQLPFKLYAKNEAVNPTGSFKDRGSSVEVAAAVTHHAKRAAVASTGNMGASLAAYSGKAGIPLTVYTPKDAAPTKLEQILAYGAHVVRVRQVYSEVIAGVEALCKEKKVYLLGDYVFRREGTKTVGCEIAEQLGRAPDTVVVPIGNGLLFSGVWKAFTEFKKLKWIRNLPRMVGVQATGCKPVVNALRSGRWNRVERPKTVAMAIECDLPMDGLLVLQAIRASRGTALSVGDREILRAVDLLAQHEGLFAEPAGAAALAGILKDPSQYRRGSTVVCVVSGHGLKAPHHDPHHRMTERATVL